MVLAELLNSFSDAGPLRNARLLEPFAYLNIQLGYMLGLGAEIGFKLVH